MKKTFTWCQGVVRRFLKNNCGMHAAGLTYFSLLEIGRAHV